MSDEGSINETVIDIFKVHTGVWSADCKTKLSSLHGDSLDAVEIMCALEDELDIDVVEEYLWRCLTIGDCIQYVQGLVNQNADT
ncbi:MAG: hypothetical protein JKX92_12345 [Porticoccaceae bacterium]|nr:hypothetical protein [Porticoccaceae bacterium]